MDLKNQNTRLGACRKWHGYNYVNVKCPRGCFLRMPGGCLASLLGVWVRGEFPILSLPMLSGRRQTGRNLASPLFVLRTLLGCRSVGPAVTVQECPALLDAWMQYSALHLGHAARAIFLTPQNGVIIQVMN